MNNSNSMLNGMPPVKKQEKRVGPIVGVLVIILLIIVLVLYFFGQRLNTAEAPRIVPEQNVATNTEAVTPADIDNMSNGLDNELKDVDFSF